LAKEERARRVANRIQEELAVLFQREVSDPRLRLLTITGVEVDRELAFATIYVSSLNDQDGMEDVIRALDGAKGFLRSQLASRIPLRSFPQLRFRHDSTPNQGARIDELLAEIREDLDTAEEEDS
jgi:ribosome-binding factor A